MLVQLANAPAQDISFFHLNTSNGLSDNLVSCAARDKDGILWIGTAEGVNSYDGYTIKKYYKEDHPGLTSNNIASMLVDDSNRIWIRNYLGKITLIDEKRNFREVPVLDNGKEDTAITIVKTKTRGVTVLNGRKIYVLKKDKEYFFERLKWNEDTSLAKGYVQLKSENSDTVVIVNSDRFCVFDMANLKVLYKVRATEVIGVAWLNDKELIVTTGYDRELFKVNLSQQSIVHNYGDHVKDQYGQPIKGYLRHIRRMNDGRFIMTSGYGGVYIFDPVSEEICRYEHDPLDTRSISANNTAHVFTESSGYVYITTRSAGLNYFNSNHHLAGYRSSFQETSTGKIFHGFVNYVTGHRDGNYWLGTQTGLIEWDRKLNNIKFHEYGVMNGAPLNGVEEVRALCFDNQDKLWVGMNRYGIAVLDKKRKVIKYFNTDKKNYPDNLPGNWINNIVLSPDNKIWVATAGGLAIIDPESLTVESLERSSLEPLTKVHCNTVWFRNPYEVWISTTKGAYRYRKNLDQLALFNTENGLSTDVALCFTEDKNGVVYIGTTNALNLVNGNTVVKIFTKENGLKNERCYGLIRDAEDNIWIGNDNILLCYTPSDSSFSIFDETTGINPAGFRSLSYYQSPSGEQFWGSDAGISFFKPDNLKKLRIPFSVSIGSIIAGNKTIGFIPGEKISLPWSQNNLLFNYTAVDLYSSKNIIYEYKLDGADDNWKRTLSPQQIAYTKLSSGSYTFHVRASKNGIDWIEASNLITINIQTPWWRSTPFICLYILAFTAVVYYFLRSRSQKIKQQKEELETEQAINHFTTSLHEQKTVDDILWDVAQKCIGRLNFEDCVIYLKDEKRNVLVQKAAWGPKTTWENPAGGAGKILNPLEIPVGSGIVGHVAKTGNAEIINDTSKDARYIVDDVRRFSEITVPIISDGKVLGVIDSEHSKKNFFTQKHLFILNTIASLCANKITRTKAEEERQRAEKNLLETQRQTAEMEMQALRAQMNPHFMFNSLNSINNFILKNDPDNASQYLTRFSRLMRLILDNSREEWVLLENEIRALQLYIEMEAIRFDNAFDYKINTALDVNPSSVIVPPMIVQPYVENAIWHGLLHRKEPGSKLEIDIWKNNGELFIKVEDNGVGRMEAELLKSKFSSHKKSHGMKITAKRLDMVNTIYKVDAKVKIEDIQNGSGRSAGTSVLLQLKYKTSHTE